MATANLKKLDAPMRAAGAAIGNFAALWRSMPLIRG
jgi:hypothetical protein